MPSQPYGPDDIATLRVPDEDWQQTPPSVRALVSRLQEIIAQLVQRVEELEARLGQNSQNSSRPPSSDPPQQRAKRRKSKGKENLVPRRATSDADRVFLNRARPFLCRPSHVSAAARNS